MDDARTLATSLVSCRWSQGREHEPLPDLPQPNFDVLPPPRPELSQPVQAPLVANAAEVAIAALVKPASLSGSPLSDSPTRRSKKNGLDHLGALSS